MIYYALHPETGLLKIGMAKHIKVRFKAHRIDYGVELALIAFEHGYRERETELHKRFNRLRVTDNRIKGVEWFIPDNELVEYIETECCPADVYNIMMDYKGNIGMRQAIRYMQKQVTEKYFGNDYILSNLKRFYFDCPDRWWRY